MSKYTANHDWVIPSDLMNRLDCVKSRLNDGKTLSDEQRKDVVSQLEYILENAVNITYEGLFDIQENIPIETSNSLADFILEDKERHNGNE